MRPPEIHCPTNHKRWYYDRHGPVCGDCGMRWDLDDPRRPRRRRY